MDVQDLRDYRQMLKQVQHDNTTIKQDDRDMQDYNETIEQFRQLGN